MTEATSNTPVDASPDTQTVVTPDPKTVEPERTFKQADVDRIVVERVGREKATFKRQADELVAEKASLTETVKSYEATLEKLLAPQKELVPPEFRSLLDKLSPLEQLEWLADNVTRIEKRKIPIKPGENEEPHASRVKPIATVF